MKKEMGFFCWKLFDLTTFQKWSNLQNDNVKNVTISPPKLPSKPCFPCRLAFQFLV